MEESVKVQQQSVAPLGKSSKLRYPLRSASKVKDEANKSPQVGNNSTPVTSKRGRPPSVSKSVSTLELSSKDKAGKPPRRLSIPAKSTASPGQKSASNVTPISEARARRSANGQDNCDTPQSDIFRSSTRRKFSVLTSASYWLSQIKLAESASKHSISLGFFKLALEAGCEPLQLLREELKSYGRRHNLVELAETAKSLLESYEISESFEQLQVSQTCSHMPEDETTASGGDISSTSSTIGNRKLKPKSLNTDGPPSSAKAPSSKEKGQIITPSAKLRASVNRNLAKPTRVTGNGVDNIKKRVQRPGKEELRSGENKMQKQDEKAAAAEDSAKAPIMEDALEGNKENLDAPLLGEESVIEAN